MISRDYIYSNYYSHLNEFAPIPESTYFYGYSPESRSHGVDQWIKIHGKSSCFVGIEIIKGDIICDILTGNKYNLRSSNNIKNLLLSYKADNLYIDVTGLNNRICASLLKNLFLSSTPLSSDIRTIYIEPDTYNIKKFCTAGFYYDLSEEIDGIDPLPGFASIIPDDDADIIFVPLLGFEGGRFTHLLEEIQPPEDNIYPVVGVPGFRLEYPFVAYWGNRQPLTQTEAWRNIKYAAANSLVDVYELFSKIHQKYPKCRMKIAPIGTKPHAIGAMLYALKHQEKVELIYDNPKRSKERTKGVGKIVECFISKLFLEH